jgi:putative FmdB family regulatory protein
MPLYDYDCSACGRRFEVVHGVYAEGPTVCPICGKGPIHKAIAAPAVHFKGTGWAKRDRRATATPGTSKTSPDGSSADGDAKGNDARTTRDEAGTNREHGVKRDGAGSSSGSPAATATKAADSGTTGGAD